jgi:hypothetical protein
MVEGVGQGQGQRWKKTIIYKLASALPPANSLELLPTVYSTAETLPITSTLHNDEMTSFVGFRT